MSNLNTAAKLEISSSSKQNGILCQCLDDGQTFIWSEEGDPRCPLCRGSNINQNIMIEEVSPQV